MEINNKTVVAAARRSNYNNKKEECNNNEMFSIPHNPYPTDRRVVYECHQTQPPSSILSVYNNIIH